MTLLGFLDIAVLILHVIVCLFLVGIVLLQGGKGAAMSASFGMGSSSSAFGARTDTFMTKLTSGAAIAFVVTSISLTYLASRTGALSQRLDVEDQSTQATPTQEAPPAPEGQAPAAVPAEAPVTTESAPAGR